MFCIECGKPLPEGAKFCAYCGKPQPDLPAVPEQTTAVPDISNDLFTPLFPVERPDSVPGCSEKQGNLVYAPGFGPYFIKDNNLFFFSEKDKKLHQLTKTRDGGIDGLNYWNGEVFYWKETDFGASLFAVQAGSHERRAVKVKPAAGQEEGGIDFYDSRFIIRNGVGYSLCRDRKHLYVLDLMSGCYQCKELPDMRTQPFPEHWKNHPFFDNFKCSHEMDRWNYGEGWYGFYMQGEYGYTAVDGCIPFVVRFSLVEPSQFVYMPAGCGDITRDNGLFSVYEEGSGGRKFILGTNKTSAQGGISLTECMRDGSMKVCETAALKLKDSRAAGWWRAGDRYVIENYMFDMKAMKIKRLPFTLPAQDFIETGSGIYVYDRDLYFLPKDFAQVIRSEEELEQYTAAKLE